MSHFTVAVIYDRQLFTLEQMLDPYYEGLSVPAYIGKTRQECIEEQRHWNEMRLKRQNGESSDSVVEVKESDEELYKQYREENDYSDFDEDGNQLSTYNPMSKWDWWVLGGRWSGSLKVRPEYMRNIINENELEIQHALNTQKLLRSLLLIHDICFVDDPDKLKSNLQFIYDYINKDENSCFLLTNILNRINEMITDLSYGIDISTSHDEFVKYLMHILDEDYSNKLNALTSERFFNEFIKCGEKDIFNSDLYPVGYCDSAPVKCVDLDFAETDKIDYYKRFWAINVEGAEQTEEEKDSKKYDSMYSKKYYLERYGNVDTYVKEMTTFVPYAILYHGEWIEPGTMGWFGCSDADEEGYAEFREKWEEVKSIVDPDDIIAVVDCHI